MPHKHKRKRDDDKSNFDLDPSNRAKPLAAYNKASIFSKDDDDEKPSNKRRRSNGTKPKKAQDDTPKAFARLMAWQAAGKKPNGLDEGITKATKKQRKQQQQQQPQSNPRRPDPQTTDQKSKATATSSSTSNPPPPTTSSSFQSLKILPGEALSTFALRVDQSLPLSALTKPTNTQSSLPADLAAQLKKSQRTTKHNKRLQKMQADWRTTETKLRDKEADEADDLEEKNEEEALLWTGVTRHAAKKGKKKKKGIDEDDDPWKELEKKRRAQTKQKNLQDVVKAPPVLKKVKSKFKTREEDFEVLDGRQRDYHDEDEVLVDVSNVPNAVGSLRRREELNVTRRAVIDGYRKLRSQKRGVDERLSLSRAIVT